MGTRHEGARRSRRRQITHAGTATARARRCRARAHDGYAQAGAWHALAHPILAACNICLFFHTAGSSWNRNIPGHTKNKDQTRAENVLCPRITLSAGLKKVVRTHKHANTFGVRVANTCLQQKTYRTKRGEHEKNIQNKAGRA